MTDKPITHHPAYKAGLRATNYSQNPYEENTAEYDLFERGLTQKFKATSGAGDGFFSDFCEPTEPMTEERRLYFLKLAEDSKKTKPRTGFNIRSYKEARDGF